jgi:methylaspartate ammonia-lyase
MFWDNTLCQMLPQVSLHGGADVNLGGIRSTSVSVASSRPQYSGCASCNSSSWSIKLIKNVLSAPALGAFFYDDQRAIRGGAVQEGFLYTGNPQTDGFSSIRMPAEAMSLGLALDDGYVAWGDMMSVQYAGAGGRETVFSYGMAQDLLQQELSERLLNVSLHSFRDSQSVVLDALSNGDSVPLSVQYGISQALLRAVAHIRRKPMAAVLAEEYDLPLIATPVPLYAQSGDERYVNVEKMVLKGVEVLPHGLINAPSKLGENGEKFLEYVRWVRSCALRLGGQDYAPTLHFDVYGNIGIAFRHNIEKMAEYIGRVADAAGQLKLNIESPGDFGSTEAQIDGFARLRARLRSIGCRAKIVADEWCDQLADIEAFVSAGAVDIVQIKMPDVGSIAHSMDAAAVCKAGGVGAYMGGSCVETDLSARASVHVAVAVQADMQLAKPGMGVDEAISIVRNEQSRLLSELAVLSK